MSKGSAKAAQAQVGKDNANADYYNTQAFDVNSKLFPFLSGEMANPQGFGPEAVQKMLTKSGQITAAGVGGADEKANLNAERTGNTAAIPGVIGDTTRNAMAQESNNALGIDLANEQEKEKQRQAGAGGLGNLENMDVNANLKSLGLADDSINAWTTAKHAANQDILGYVDAAAKIAGTGASMGMGGAGAGIPSAVTPGQVNAAAPLSNSVNAFPWLTPDVQAPGSTGIG